MTDTAHDTDDSHILLARIDERTRTMAARLGTLEAKIEASYITRLEFAPVQRIVYGLVSVVLLTVLGGLVALVVRRP